MLNIVSPCGCNWILNYSFAENTGGCQQLWPRFYTGRANPHANWWPHDPFNQSGRVSKLLLHFARTAGELRVSSLMHQSACTCLILSSVCSFVWDCSQQYIQYDTVTFPRDMRVQSGEESAKHMLDKNWGCTWWTLKRSCDSWKLCLWSAFEMTFSSDCDAAWFVQRFAWKRCICQVHLFVNQFAKDVCFIRQLFSCISMSLLSIT